MLNTVSTVLGVAVASFADPYAARQSNPSPVEMATEPLNPAFAQELNAASISRAHNGGGPAEID
ncbi:hypothetical protein [Nonomuraea sp. KM90]|uniref:hypothetical protein n=1 Tax=Nonomuraea sp. KM90 TaxID=3457428 RepID=UPI003FCE4A30